MVRKRILALALTCAAGYLRPAPAQELRPTVRVIAHTGEEWISGIIETRNGRFIIYAAGDSIFVRDRTSGVTHSAFGRATDAVVNSLSSSASGDRIVFVSRDDDQKGPYVWTLAIDTLNGRPIGPARRVGVMPAADPTMSPDGRRIAFAERNPARSGIAGGALRLYVIPSNGGDAALVADMTGHGPIRVPRWSADGNSIYFQIYPPAPALGTGPSLWRVPASGGRPDSLGRVNLFTDASPDGRYLAMFPYGTNWQGTTHALLAVTTADAKPLGSFALPIYARPYSWSLTGAPKILAVHGTYPMSVKSLSLSDGSSTKIEGNESLRRKIRYAPDGKSFAYQALINDRFKFVVRESRGGASRVISTQNEPDLVWQWSPDGSSIAFISGSEGRWLTVINLATGVERKLVNLAPVTAFLWRSDSKALFYIAQPSPPAKVPSEIRAITVDGRSSRAGSIPSTMVPGDWNSLVDDSTFLFRHEEGGVRKLSLVSMTTGSQRTIYTGPVSRSASPAILSPDRKWVTFGVSVPNAGGEQVAIAALDGSGSRVVGPPQACGAGAAAWHPDGRHILVWAYPSCTGEGYREVLYLFSLNGDPPRQLTQESGGQGENSYSLSPDGRTVLYELEDGPGTRSIIEIDFTGTLTGRSGGPAQRKTPSPHP